MNKIIAYLWLKDAHRKINRIEKFLKKDYKILDVGGGPGTVCYLLKCMGFNSKTIDIKDLSIFKDIKTLIYDGQKFPFKDNSFDLTLILTVLHHTISPETILSEAKRVSRRIIIIEDIYKNQFQKYFTFLMDSLVNFQFFNHPHNNKNHKNWLESFKKLKLKLLYYQIDRNAPFLYQATYFLET
ncbi:MAG: class I SAM-dependent methyltransferase [Candidatus Lokiarchaeota archaeon]